MHRSFFRILSLLLLLLACVAWAEESVALTLESRRVQTDATEDGVVERFTPALEVAPGDLIEWRLSAVNITDRSLREVMLDLPLPSQVSYLAGSARAGLGPDAMSLEVEDEVEDEATEATLVARFSADGGATFHLPPLLRTVTRMRDGEQVVVEVPVDPSEYTHARVILPEFEAGRSFTFVVRTEVR